MEQDRLELINLINTKLRCESILKNMLFGAIEIRKTNNKDYIYLHYRDNGTLLTKYVGEYSKELHELILKNNIEARRIKKEIKKIKKELDNLGYIESNLNPLVETNIDLARKNMIDIIYKQSILENIVTTYSDTQTIIEGGKVFNMTSDDVRKIINLKHSWEFILDEDVISSNNDFMLLSEINKLVIEGFYYSAGKIRNIPVIIGGTTWKPELPIESIIREELNDIYNKNISVLDKAIELLLYIMKKQIFIDGNKRTAVIFANHLLISNACGLVVIPAELTAEFKKLLISYYEDNNIHSIKEFLLEKCYIKL